MIEKQGMMNIKSWTMDTFAYLGWGGEWMVIPSEKQRASKELVMFYFLNL